MTKRALFGTLGSFAILFFNLRRLADSKLHAVISLKNLSVLLQVLLSKIIIGISFEDTSAQNVLQIIAMLLGQVNIAFDY